MSAVSITSTMTPVGASGCFDFAAYVTNSGPCHVPDGGGSLSASATAAASDAERRHVSSTTAGEGAAAAFDFEYGVGGAPLSSSSASAADAGSSPIAHARNLSATTRELGEPEPETLNAAFFAISLETPTACSPPSMSAATSNAHRGFASAPVANARSTRPHSAGGGPFVPPMEAARARSSRISSYAGASLPAATAAAAPPKCSTRHSSALTLLSSLSACSPDAKAWCTAA